MRLTLVKNTVLLFLFLAISCANNNKSKLNPNNEVLKHVRDDKIDSIITNKGPIIMGANQIGVYLPLLKGKRVGMVTNQTSVVSIRKDSAFLADSETNEVAFYEIHNRYTHVVDSLLSYKINIKKVFAPEHGFRGTADAGEIVKDGIDTKTGLPIVSLYGKNKKPSKEQLLDLDVIVFDIQDVGARFYTYISSLHYVMEACAENNIPLIVLDRPNPNGHYIDGPILEPEHQSFVGMHPVPVVHGMTIGEYARMINGEGWLKNKVKCTLTVIPLKNYSRDMFYDLPIKPSPNLPNAKAINLYPSLCFFEGTNVSVGRGTNTQFQIYGSPFLPKTNFSFSPKPNFGAKYPKHDGKICNGYDLTEIDYLESLDLSILLNAYNITEDKDNFFISNGFFTKLAGTKKLQEQIEKGFTEAQIKATWSSGLEHFLNVRSKYILYN